VEDYVHRIGRTGRGGASGISHTFFTDFDKGLAGALVAVLQEANQEVPKDIYKHPLITKKKTSKVFLFVLFSNLFIYFFLAIW
jgi:ATP-dependent RNA helicase DBP3